MDDILRIKVKKIVILYGSGADKIMVYIDDMIEGTWPFENNLVLKFECAMGTGMDYISKNFRQVTKIECVNINCC